MNFIDYATAAPRMDWRAIVEVLREGHTRPRPEQGDILLGHEGARMLSRAASIPGMGYVLKSQTTIPANAARGLPTIQGLVLLFDPDTGAVRAVIDGALVTAFKTAADSVLGAQLLARPDSRNLLIAGAGEVARNLVPAYAEAFPGLDRITIWARTPSQAEALLSEMPSMAVDLAVARDLDAAVQQADIISTATGAHHPFLRGDLVRPGSHVDLIGSFTPEMREADDALIAKARVHVDYRDTTIDVAGDLTQPIAAGVIRREDVLGDLYDLIAGAAGRGSAQEITLYKNGGGAHLDLMVAVHVARVMGISGFN